MKKWNIFSSSRRCLLLFFRKNGVFIERKLFFSKNKGLLPPFFARFISLSPKIKSSVESTSLITTPFKKFLSEPSFYAVIHIYGRSFIVTEGDVVTLPQRLCDVKPGDIIRLNSISKLGSRNYTLKGQPYIDEKLYTCRARVLELTKAPMSYFIKKKRRQRRIKVVKSKQDYTVLRICEITIHDIHK
ncbi:hypothetical protein PNEG_00084 [Pneumocystis murina B123]|uniref:Large ribosomal subunit protein bL21m n=1 Tax=Pneumocystis murina (strain B123) TaxID=1069680 RepID=M7NWV9_PNEMU|nr:hypothetical protein PNEG_00084 [Pneumocystis murina B123]EMR11646.1 hypothetical protein PNEG_00084 [Pneumocystis murina B123]